MSPAAKKRQGFRPRKPKEMAQVYPPLPAAEGAEDGPPSDAPEGQVPFAGLANQLDAFDRQEEAAPRLEGAEPAEHKPPTQDDVDDGGDGATATEAGEAPLATPEDEEERKERNWRFRASLAGDDVSPRLRIPETVKRERDAQRAVEERIAEFFSSIDSGTTPVKVMLYREEPDIDPDTMIRLRGYLCDFMRPVTAAEIAHRFGGGRYRITAMAPIRPGSAKMVAQDNWWLEISGPPKIPKRPGDEEKRKESELGLVKDLMAEKEKEVDRVRDEMQELKRQQTQSQGMLPELLRELGEREDRRTQAAWNAAQRQMELAEQRLSEERRSFRAELDQLRTLMTAGTATSEQQAMLKTQQDLELRKLALEERRLELEERRLAAAKEEERERDRRADEQRRADALEQRRQEERAEDRRRAEEATRRADELHRDLLAQNAAHQKQLLDVSLAQRPDALSAATGLVTQLRTLAPMIGFAPTGQEAAGPSPAAPPWYKELAPSLSGMVKDLVGAYVQGKTGLATRPVAAPIVSSIPLGAVASVDLVPRRRLVVPATAAPPPAPPSEAVPPKPHPLDGPPLPLPQTPLAGQAATESDVDNKPFEKFKFPTVLDSINTQAVLLAKDLDLALRLGLSPLQVKQQVIDNFPKSTVATLKEYGKDRCVALIAEKAPADWPIAQLAGTKLVEALFPLL